MHSIDEFSSADCQLLRRRQFHFIGGPVGWESLHCSRSYRLHVKAKKKLIAICTATSLAALSFDGTVTAHSLFGYPVEDEEDTRSMRPRPYIRSSWKSVQQDKLDIFFPLLNQRCFLHIWHSMYIFCHSFDKMPHAPFSCHSNFASIASYFQCRAWSSFLLVVFFHQDIAKRRLFWYDPHIL